MGRVWESYCHRCGLCCYEKIRHPGGVWELDRSSPCPWLNTETGLCKVYERRLRVYPRCRRITLFRAFFAPYLPAGCGYVRSLRPSWFPGSRIVISDMPKKEPAGDCRRDAVSNG